VLEEEEEDEEEDDEEVAAAVDGVPEGWGELKCSFLQAAAHARQDCFDMSATRPMYLAVY